MKSIYPIAIEVGTDSTAYGVVVPDMTGCFSAGDSMEEAFANTREAIAAWIEATLDDNAPLPPASAPDRWINDPEYAGWMWGVIEVDLDKYLGPAERINVTLSRRVLTAIDDFTATTGESRSGFLARAAVKEILWESKEKLESPDVRSAASTGSR